MRPSRRWILACALACLAPTAGLAAQVGWEGGLGGTVLASDPAFLGGGPLVALRPGGRLRLQLALAAGAVDRRLAGRGELVAHFLLHPGRQGGVGVYGLGGVAAEVGPRDVGRVLLGLGLEGAPGGGSGWWLEGGVGGGARVAAGWRWRWLHLRTRP